MLMKICIRPARRLQKYFTSSSDKSKIIASQKHKYRDSISLHVISSSSKVGGTISKGPHFAIQKNLFCSGCHQKQPLATTSGRHKYQAELELAINQQIIDELNAGYVYLSMACYFGDTNVALPGAEGLYMKMFEEECGHTMQLIKYQHKRGGRVCLGPIKGSEETDWKSITNTLEVSLEMEKCLRDKLEGIVKLAEKQGDVAVQDFITTDFIHEQDRSIQEFGRLLLRSRKMTGCGCTEFLFDQELFKIFVRESNKDKPYI